MHGYHFIAERGKLRDGSPAADPNGLETFAGPLELCLSGLHFSPDILNALKYAPGPILRFVNGAGALQMGDDKCVCSERLVHWTFDATALLHEFACCCAERALSRVKNHDPGSVAAIEAKRAWLRGEITNAQLAAAWDAARDDWDDALDAARYAARAAARDAARAATRAAAGAAARDAAWYAAEADERDWQRNKLLSMIEEARR